MILVLGATGTIGRHLVTLLAARDERIRVVSRSEERVSNLRAKNVDVVVGDIRDRAVADRAFAGVRRAFVATNSSPEQQSIETAVFEAATRHGIDHLVKVSVIAPSADHVVELARDHCRIEENLAKTGLAYTILRPNWFMENFFGSAGTIAQGSIYGSAGEGRIGFVDARDIAAVADAVLRDPTGSARELVITGPAALTFAEAAAAIGDGLRKPVSYVDLDEKSFAGALGSAGLPPPVIEVVLQINRNAKQGGLAIATDTVKVITGRAPRSLSEFTRDHAARFTG